MEKSKVKTNFYMEKEQYERLKKIREELGKIGIRLTYSEMFKPCIDKHIEVYEKIVNALKGEKIEEDNFKKFIEILKDITIDEFMKTMEEIKNEERKK